MQCETSFSRSKASRCCGSGIKVLRFWNHQLRGELEAVRFEIWHALLERTGRTEELAGWLPGYVPPGS
jgi:hypothetical protein